MTNGNSKQQALPKTATVPMPPRVQGPGPDVYGQRGHNSFLSPIHEDVGRAMQNVIDLQTEVARLRKENQEWERRALLAEGKVEQMKLEIADTKDDFNKDVAILKGRHVDEVARVTRDLDYFKGRDAVVQTKLAIGAQHFIDCIDAVAKDRKDTENKVLSGMEAEMTKAIDESNKGNDPVHD
jgi:hypothetical protein